MMSGFQMTSMVLTMPDCYMLFHIMQQLNCSNARPLPLSLLCSALPSQPCTGQFVM